MPEELPEGTPAPEAPAGTPAAPAPPPAPPAPDTSREQGLQNALSRMGGDAMRLANTLYTENYDYRKEIRDLKSKVIPEGAVVLTGEEAKAYEALKGL